ncbi:dual specificity protein phosphatase CDC14AB isoform X2 [Anarrhichthys ocellatus]|uniref:dual specificity protein phosphatase CDC14AB isoform X2 n=1 Tax=Anarrhichthys ocellatus TaxID=433405 RepID=UPI0012EECA7E|nr:dual specificity protein phosphatase CDC14AB-like isoform X2 [Anarrhichthys ocellatus]
MKTHSRSASQPLRWSMGGQGPPAPLKASKFSASSASAAAKRIGRSPSSTASNIRSSTPSPLAPPSLCRYGNGPRGAQHEANNNSSRPGPQDFRGPGPYSALKGPSGRYLSRSIPSLPSEYIQY